MRRWAPLAMVSGLALAVGAWACGSSSSSDAPQCAPQTSISGSGIVDIQTLSGFTEYTLSNAQVEDLFNAGSLTVHAGDADAGAGSLAPSDPVVLVHMKVAPDDPGTYELSTLTAQIAYCSVPTAKLVVTGGQVTGCAPSGSPMTMALGGTLQVSSSTSKMISPEGAQPISLTAKIGTQDRGCN